MTLNRGLDKQTAIYLTREYYSAINRNKTTAIHNSNAK